MQTLRTTVLRPALLLAALFVFPACGAGKDDDGGTEGGEGEGEAGGDDLDQGVVEVESLFLTEADGAAVEELRQGLSGEALWSTVRDAMAWENGVLRAAFGALKDITATPPVVDRPAFRVWEHTGEHAQWRFNLLRTGTHLFHYGLQVRPLGSDRPLDWRRALWGALLRVEARRGAGRMHVNFDAMNRIDSDAFPRTGQAEFRFLNTVAGTIVNMGLAGYSNPETGVGPVGAVSHYRKGPEGGRVFKFVVHKDVGGGPEREYLGARAAWKRGVGGRLDAVVAAGNVPDPPGHVGYHGCWDADRNPVMVLVNPPAAAEPLGIEIVGEAGDCVAAYQAQMEGIDPAEADPADEANWGDEGVEIPDLPSADDAAEGAADDPGE